MKNPPNKACSRLVGFVPTYRLFSRFRLFPALRVLSRPAHQRLTQTVGTPLAEEIVTKFGGEAGKISGG